MSLLFSLIAKDASRFIEDFGVTLLVVTPWFHMSDRWDPPKNCASHRCVSVGSPISETNQFGSPFTRPRKLTKKTKKLLGKSQWLLMIINGKTHYFDWAMAFLWFLALPLDQTWLGNPLERNSAKPRRGTAGDLSSADVFTTLGMLRDDW